MIQRQNCKIGKGYRENEPGIVTTIHAKGVLMGRPSAFWGRIMEACPVTRPRATSAPFLGVTDRWCSNRTLRKLPRTELRVAQKGHRGLMGMWMMNMCETNIDVGWCLERREDGRGSPKRPAGWVRGGAWWAFPRWGPWRLGTF